MPINCTFPENQKSTDESNISHRKGKGKKKGEKN